MPDTIPNPYELVAERIKKAEERYLAAAHAMQTGVAYTMQPGNASDETSPKHLRVGVNSAMVDSAALATVLIRKGIISELEYKETLAELMEKEVETYRDQLQQRTGSKITLI